jgi:mevalonate kinase
MLFKASAPGSLMLMGEYAVLKDGYAVVVAINRRMSVCLSPRTDFKIKIISQLGVFESEISDLQVQAPFQFVLTALKKYQPLFPSGCDIEIHSEFSDKIGFASSAATTVAVLTVLHQWLNRQVSQSDLIREARSIVREVQGVGSGADVAACVLGGVVAYRAEPFSAEKLHYSHPITVVYSGSKTKTVDAVNQVNDYFSKQPELFEMILQSINRCAQAGIKAIKENNSVELGKLMNIQQGLMESLGVCTPALQIILNKLRGDSTIFGAKISGSGLGDCAIGLGSAAIKEEFFMDVTITSQGVCNE